MNHATRAFTQVDVFTDTPLLGNALAVVLEAEGLSDAQMQALAQWTNLSETAFVLPPTEAGADYRVRIFTPGGELPFAGHPTLGSCHAWLEADGQPQDPEFIVQQCAVGLVRIRRGGSRLAFAAPACRRSPIAPELLAQISDALGLQAGQLRASQSLDNGPVWLSLLLDAPETVLALQPDHGRLRELGVKVGVAAAYRPAGPALIARANREARASRSETAPANPEPDLEVRAFAAAMGILEDPVTGSLNASLAQWLIEEKRMPKHYVAGQGHALDRQGRVHIRQDASGQVWVGGDTVVCIEGQVALD
jgi:PhzF family phenazine biosynthesis protein